MKKLFVIATILSLAGGLGWNLHRQNTALGVERARLELELAEAGRQFAGITNEISRLETEWITRQASLRRPEPSSHPSSPAAPVVPSFGPPDGKPSWSETDSFIWIEESAIPSLGLSAFGAADSVEPLVSAEAARLITRISRAFLEANPEFVSYSSASPERAAELQAEYLKMLTTAAANLDERGRQAIASTIRQIENLQIAGRMTQAPADYRLNPDVAELLGMTAVERELVERLTRDIVDRYRSLERQNVSASDDHSPESTGPNGSMASFKVAAFPAEGSALRTEWTAQLEATIGPDRTRHLQRMCADWVRSDLGDFGEAERTVTFREGGGSFGISDRSTTGYSSNMGTGGPTPVPPGWRHLIARPPERGLPALRSAP